MFIFRLIVALLHFKSLFFCSFGIKNNKAGYPRFLKFHWLYEAPIICTINCNLLCLNTLGKGQTFSTSMDSLLLYAEEKTWKLEKSNEVSIEKSEDIVWSCCSQREIKRKEEKKRKNEGSNSSSHSSGEPVGFYGHHNMFWTKILTGLQTLPE